MIYELRLKMAVLIWHIWGIYHDKHILRLLLARIACAIGLHKTRYPFQPLRWGMSRASCRKIRDCFPYHHGAPQCRYCSVLPYWFLLIATIANLLPSGYVNAFLNSLWQRAGILRVLKCHSSHKRQWPRLAPGEMCVAPVFRQGQLPQLLGSS